MILVLLLIKTKYKIRTEPTTRHRRVRCRRNEYFSSRTLIINLEKSILPLFLQAAKETKYFA